MKKIALSLAVIGLLTAASMAYAVNPMLLKQKNTGKGTPTEEAVQLPKNLHAEEVDAIIARLNDDQVRRLLIAQLQAAAQEAPGAGATAPASGLGKVIQWFESRTELLVSRVYRLGVGLPTISGDLGRAMDQLTDYQWGGRFWVMVLMVLVFLAVGYGAE